MTDPAGSVPADRHQPAGKAKTSFADLLPRLLSAIVLIALALATALTGGLIFDLFWWAAALAVLWEWEHLVVPARPLRPFAMGGLALTVAAPLIHVGAAGWSLAFVLIGALAVSAATAGPNRVLAGSGVLYAGALVLSVTLLRSSAIDGLEAVLWLFAVVWGTDIMAYFGGRLIGGPKLWPRLSPSKTWSGFLTGIASGAVAGLVVAPTSGRSAAVLFFGLALGAVSQGGDVLESGLKRRCNVKDASHLIPGHGGVMDRLDGFVAAALAAALIGVSRFGMEAPGAGLFQW